jgi:hypothetical protein
MSEPVQPTQTGSPTPPPPPSPAAQTPGASRLSPMQESSGRAGDAGATEESVRRKLLMGAALLLALASIYAGVFNVGRLAQIVLAAGATMAVVLAMTSNRRRNS